MTAYVRDIAPPDHLAAVLGCRLNDAGECTKHQSRPFDPRQVGCPLVDAIRREGRDRR